MTTWSQDWAKSNFKMATIRKLGKLGITIIRPVAVPTDGTWINPEVCVELNDNGTSRIRSFLEVLAIADGKLAIVPEA